MADVLPRVRLPGPPGSSMRADFLAATSVYFPGGGGRRAFSKEWRSLRCKSRGLLRATSPGSQLLLYMPCTVGFSCNA
jgi:hypothetical protein